MDLHDSQTSEPAQEQATASIDLDQPADEVWQALVDPERLAAWMGTGSAIDLSPGGEVRLADLVTGVPKRGRVASVVPERSIEFVWWPEDDPDQTSQVSFTMLPVTEADSGAGAGTGGGGGGGGTEGGSSSQRTRFTVVETRPATATARARASAGADHITVGTVGTVRPSIAVATAGWWWRVALLAVVTAGTVAGVAATTRPVIGAVA